MRAFTQLLRTHSEITMLPKISDHPSLIYADDIAAICRPLQKLNINYFAHATLNKDKQFSAVSTHPAYAKHYIGNQCYNIDIHTADEHQIGNYVVWDAFELSGKSAIEHQTAIQFGVEHIFTIVEKNQNDMHFYHFGSNLLGKAINQVYLSHVDLLKLFICHFKDKISCHKHLRQAYDLKFLIDDNAEGYSIKTNFSKLDQQRMKTAFLKDLQLINTTSETHKSLTNREIEILMWLHHGKTANDIATILQLADVTVNKHIANIKEKAQCYTQFQLGEFFSNRMNKLT
jgi:DNA-binding CsgD family transcriptional regulator